MRVKWLSLVVLALLGAIVATAADWRQHVRQYYFNPDRETTLTIPLDGAGELPFQILDYYGEEVSNGTVTLADGVFTLPVQLPRGFYQLVVGGEKDRFWGLYSAPQLADTELGDPYFGVDACFSWMYSDYTPQRRKELAQVLKANHMGIVRERFSLRHLNPEAGVMDFSPDQDKLNYDSLRAYYREIGLPILDVYHDTPDAMKTAGRILPDDPVAVADTFARLAERWGAGWGGYEIWNEPDLTSIPDMYAPYLKAMVAGAKAIPDVTLLGLVSCESYPGPFHEYAAKNDVLSYISGVSYHAYGSGLMFEDTVALFREFLGRYGAEGMPLWVTEANRSYNGLAHGDELQREYRASAMNVAVAALEGKACGLARFFPFIFAGYNEGPFAFGMIGRNESPLQLAAAYFTCAEVLAGHEYIGDWQSGDEQLARARVFADPSGEQVVVAVVTPSANEPHVLRKAWRGHWLDVDGRLLAEGSGNDVTIRGGVAYLLTDAKSLAGEVNADTRAMKLLRMARSGVQPRRKVSSLILQPRPNLDEVFNRTNSAYVYDVAEMPESITLPLRIANLSDETMSVALSWSFRTPDSAEVFPEGRGTQTIAVPGKEIVNIELPFALKRLLAQTPDVELVITANSGDWSDVSVLHYVARQFETYRAARIGTPSTSVNFASQRHWHSMGALWQWEQDLNCSFDVQWSEEKLVVTVKAYDDTHSQQQFAQKLWMGDSLQLAVQALSAEGNPVPDETLELAVALNAANASEFYPNRRLSSVAEPTLMASVLAQVTREGNLTNYQVEITPAALGLSRFEAGQQLGLSLLINDDDGFGRKGSMLWGDGIATFNGNTRTYNRVQLD